MTEQGNDSDLNFEELENQLAQMRSIGYKPQGLNFFHALNLASNELVHSAFIAWLLSPNNILNAENKITEKFLMLLYDYRSPKCGEIVDNKRVLSNEEIINLNEDDFRLQTTASGKAYNIRTEHVIKNKENRIDVFMDFGDTVIVVENKIDTKPHDNQLCRYMEEVNKNQYGKYRNKIYVYLSPRVKNGELPTNIGGDEEYNDGYCVLDYVSILTLIQYAIKEAKERKTDKEYIKFLEKYKEMLEVEVTMNNNDVRAKCKEICKKYARELEMIMGYNDNIHDVLRYVKKYVEDKGMHIFVPARKTNGEQVSFDFYSDKLDAFFGYDADKNNNKTKTGAGYYHCGTDGGNVLCIWHLADKIDTTKRKSIPQKYPASYKLVTLLTWEERAKEFVLDGNCDCTNTSILCEQTMKSRLDECFCKIAEFEKDL